MLDVLPLLLSILDLPISRRLDGRVPAEILTPEVDPHPPLVDRYPIAPVSLEAGVESRAPDDDRQLLERLRGLGYLDDDSPENPPPAGAHGGPGR